jgi:WD40 repeat protein
MSAHSDAVSALAISGERLLSAAWDGTVMVWSISNSELRPVVALTDHECEVRSLAIDSTGNVAVSGSDDGKILVWDLRQKSSTRTIEAHADQVASLVLTPDGKGAVSCSSDSYVKLFEVGSGRNVQERKGSNGFSCVKTDGFTMITGDTQGVIGISELKTFRQTEEIPSEKSGSVCDVAVFSDGRQLIAGYGRKTNNIIHFKS